MCGRYVSPDTAAIERAWQVGRGNCNPFPRRFNVLPTTNIPILRAADAGGGLELAQARWGLIPTWWKEDRPPTYSINARAEDAAGKPMWRDAYRRSRCLIPAEGWYEWQKTASGKQPHFIFRRDRHLVCFAGLMAQWRAREGEPLLSCAILTRQASASLAEVHDRMPVVLPDELMVRWARPDVQRPEEVAAMVELAQTQFEHYSVSRRLNAARDDNSELIERAMEG